MKITTCVWTLLVLLTLALIGTDIRAQPKPSVQGVWRLVETTGKDVGRGAAPSAVNTSPQPGFTIFTAGHYSLTRVLGERPRTAAKDSTNPTLADLQEVLRFAAQAGRYEVRGNRIIFYPEAALGIGIMAPGTSFDASFTLENNTLTLTSTDKGGTGTSKMVRIE